MTRIIDLYGGPGSGKSTTAAYMFALLKQAGVNAELVREYVKEWAWEGREIGPYDQLYFLGKQIRKESMLYGRVDVIVTDSPVLLGIHYARAYSPEFIANAIEFTADHFICQAARDGHEHVHVMLRRSKAYSQAGRYQSEDEAHAIDREVERILVEDFDTTVQHLDTENGAVLSWLRENRFL